MTLPSVEDLIIKHGLRQKKSLGQHFLTDEALLAQIVSYAGDIRDHTVIEPGPGPGGLTRAIIEAGAKQVHAIEKDDRALPALQELATHADGKLHIHMQDATGLNPDNFADRPRAIISNLPYNAGTEMLTGWLKHIEADPQSISRMLLMFQKEVAERLAATPGSGQYGRLSVLTQWLCDIHCVMVIPPEAFSPPPKVDSAVVLIVPRATPLAPCRIHTLQHVTAAAFAQRRKMLRVSLKPLGAEIIATLGALDIDPVMRAENVSPLQYAQLALRLEQLRNEP